MKYRVSKQCFWDRVYEKGEVVHIEKGTNVPSYFEPLEAQKKSIPKPVKQAAKSEA